jgi:hypothetical protein
MRPRSLQFSKRVVGIGKPAAANRVSTCCSVSTFVPILQEQSDLQLGVKTPFCCLDARDAHDNDPQSRGSFDRERFDEAGKPGI